MEGLCEICSKPESSFHIPIDWKPKTIKYKVESLCGTEYKIRCPVADRDIQDISENNYYKFEEITDQQIINHPTKRVCSIQHLFEFCQQVRQFEFNKSLPLFYRIYKWQN